MQDQQARRRAQISATQQGHGQSAARTQGQQEPAGVRRVPDLDRRYGLRFGESVAQLTERDLVQLHDTVLYLAGQGEPSGERLCGEFRALLEADAEAPVLECDIDAARMVQLAVFVLQRWGKRVAPALADARLQAFRYLEREGVVEALQ